MTDPKNINRLSSHTYELPTFEVGKSGLRYFGPMEIVFCKGSKDTPVHPGLITETLIEACKMHLESVNEIVPSYYTTRMIEHLKAALEIADERIKDRKARGVFQTYQK